MRWIKEHAIALTFTVLVILVAVLFWRQQANFNQHEAINRKDDRTTCRLIQSRWDVIHQLVVIGLAPLPGDPDDNAVVNRELDDRQKQLLALLGARNTCKP